MKHKIFIISLAIFFTLSANSWADDNSLLFIGDYMGNLYAVENYTQLWEVNYSSSGCVGSPVAQDGKVIFTHLTGEVTCVNISDGSLVWQYVPPHRESAAEGLNDGAAIGGGKVYAAFTSGELRAFDLNTGKILWHYKSDQGLRTAPAYYDGLVLLGGYNGLFSIIDAETGERLNGGGAGGAVNTPSVSSGNVYYSAWDGSVHAVQLKNVIPLWNAKVDEPITTSPVIADGVIIVGTASGKIAALNQNDGAIIWEHATQGGQLKLSLSSGRVSAETEDNRFLTLDAKTGRLLKD